MNCKALLILFSLPYSSLSTAIVFEINFLLIGVDYFWTSPERLRDQMLLPSQTDDIYSFAIVLQEIVTQSPPYGNCSAETTAESIHIYFNKNVWCYYIYEQWEIVWCNFFGITLNYKAMEIILHTRFFFITK